MDLADPGSCGQHRRGDEHLLPSWKAHTAARQDLKRPALVQSMCTLQADHNKAPGGKQLAIRCENLIVNRSLTLKMVLKSCGFIGLSPPQIDRGAGMNIFCGTGTHVPGVGPIWNDGYYFTQCARCGRQMIKPGGGDRWRSVPKKYRVVWKPRTQDDVDWTAGRTAGHAVRPPLIGKGLPDRLQCVPPATTAEANAGALAHWR